MGSAGGNKSIFLAVAAIGVVAVLLMASYSENPFASDEEEEEASAPERAPILVGDGGYNIPVQDGPLGTNEPSIQVDPDDPMHAIGGANDYNTPKQDSWVGTYATFDGGRSWTKSFVPGYYGDPSSISALKGYQGAGDPVAAFGPDGTCYMAGIAFQRKHIPLERYSCIFVARSDDGGVSYDNVGIVIKSRTKGVFHDKEWIAVDMATGDIYVSWTAFYAQGAVASQILVSRSSDRGETWSVPTIVTEIFGEKPEKQVQGSYIQVDDEGTVHLCWINYEGYAINYARSYDRGATFETPRGVASVTIIPSPLDNVVHRTPTMPSMALDTTGGPYHGSVYITWPDARDGNADIYFVYSRDRGDTWTQEYPINDDGGEADQFFPSICTDEEGTVYAFFYDRRRDENNTLIDAFWAVSTDGGRNFTHQFNVTEQPFVGDAGGGSFIGQFTGGAFIGDYLQIAVGTNFTGPDGNAYHRTYMLWCDTRDGTPEDKNSDLYAARVDFPAEYVPEA